MVVPALLVVGLLAMVGGAVAIKGSSGATQGANSNNNAGNTTQDRATTTGTGTTNNPSNTATGTGPNTNPNTPTPPAREVHIVLSSEPTNAEVLENGRSLGRTPLELRLTGDDGDPARMHSFVFRLNGFNDASVTLGGSEIRYSARLSRRAVYRPPVRPNVPSGYREW